MSTFNISCSPVLFDFSIGYNSLWKKKLPKAIWVKRSEAFYPLLYDPKGKVAKQPQSRGCMAKWRPPFFNF